MDYVEEKIPILLKNKHLIKFIGEINICVKYIPFFTLKKYSRKILFFCCFQTVV